MYGVILKERTGNFIPYTFEHFEKTRHEELRKKFDEERLFTKAGYGELSSHEFLSLLGYQDTEYHMKNYIENYLSIDEAFIVFAEKYYQKYDFVLLSTDVSEWSAYITQYYNLSSIFPSPYSNFPNCSSQLEFKEFVTSHLIPQRMRLFLRSTVHYTD